MCTDDVPLELMEDILGRLPVKSLRRFRCVSKTWCYLIDNIKFVKSYLIENILGRLPVKSLKRFRCVSKTWCSLIDSKEFAKSHLRRSSVSDCRSLIADDKEIALKYPLGSENTYLITNLDLNICSRSHIFKPLNHMIQSIDSYHLYMSCNGLILLSIRHAPALWNPFTGEYKILHGSITAHHHYTNYTFDNYGFWYDEINDDYKILKVLEEFYPDYCVVEVYSLKLDCWRTIKDHSFQRASILDPLILVNGALHTLVTHNQKLQIMALNVETEEHYEVMMPFGKQTKSDWSSLVKLYGLGDCLCLVDYYYSKNMTKKYGVDIWVMKEYGVAVSWTRLLSIKNTKMKSLVKPLGYSRDGSKILLSGYKTKDDLFWYDLKHNKIMKIFLVKGIFKELIVESLVSLGTKEDSVMNYARQIRDL